jgi:WD40 repeat protein
MRALGYLFALVLLLLVGSVASAQETPKGFLDIELKDITKEEAEALSWEAPRGVKVVKPREGGPAAGAGILPDDVIISIDGVEVENMQRFIGTIGDRGPGAQVRLRVLRSGKEHALSVTLGQRPPELMPPVAVKSDLPMLMLDTGGHMAVIRGLAFTPDGKQLVSAADDKVIRVWNWQAGRTIRTMRGQVGPGPEGRIGAMALSPDGHWLAAGGFMAPGFGVRDDEVGSIRLYDFATGKLVALLKGHTNVVLSLAFSPDGMRLISGSGLGDFSAIIWDVESRNLRRRLQGHTGEIYGVAFTPDGQRVVTGSYDNTLRLWRVGDGGLIAEMKEHRNKVFGVAVNPIDSSIASGSDDGEIRLWNGTTGMPIRAWMQPGSNPASLTFSRDGKWLLSGTGTYARDHNVHVWNVADGKEILTYTQHDNVVLAAAVSPDGKFVATGGGTRFSIHVWEPVTGTPAKGLEGKPLVLAGTSAANWAVGFSADGQKVAWGTISRYSTHNDRGPLAFQIRLPGSTQGLGLPKSLNANAVKDFIRARTISGGFGLAARSGGRYGVDAILDLKQGNKVIASIERGSTNGYQHRAYTFTPDGQTIISAGDNGVITSYDLRGQRLGDFVGHEGDVVAVTPSPDGRLLISGGVDQTLRLWNLKTRELIATLFYGTDGEWVMWTPQGYYTGSPGADKIVGWQINKGSENVPDYVGADQLRQHLNRPDIVEKAIILASAEAAVRESPGTTFKLADLLARPVPRFKIMSPLVDEVQRGGRAIVKISIDATRDPIKAIRVQVNGREIGDVTPDIGSGGFGAGERMLVVPLARGKNEVRVTLTNAIGEKAEVLTLNHEGEGALDRRGTLYILAVGVDKYPGLGNTCGILGDQSCNLTVSGADARALVAAVEKRLGPAHNKVVKRLLVNGAGGKDDPTATNILDAIDILKQAEETDTVLLFIAGHGINDGPNYRFLPTNAAWDGPTLRGSTVVSWQILQEAVETAKGRRILFIDTCHSGNAYNERLGNAAYHANIIAYTAARFDQTAKEDDKLGHGLFTYAVVEGLEGKGGTASRRQISTKELADYVIKRVEELAKAQNTSQEPQYFKGRDAEDYVLARW